MHLEHVILLKKIAQEKSISKVAKSNHISQPALSQQMQRLEEELGVKLFERSNRGIELTPEGEIACKYADVLIGAYHDFLEELSDLQNQRDSFRIAATPIAGNYAIPCTLFKLKKQYPQFTFSLSSMPSGEVLRHLLDERADIGFVAGSVQESSIICQKAFSDKIYLAAAKDYRVQEPVLLSDLKKHPLIMLNESFSSYRLLVERLGKMGCEMDDMQVLYHLDSTESVKASLIGKYGMAFLPYMAIKKEVYLGQIKLVEVENFPVSYDISIICRADSFAGNHPVGSIVKYFQKIVAQAIC